MSNFLAPNAHKDFLTINHTTALLYLAIMAIISYSTSIRSDVPRIPKPNWSNYSLLGLEEFSPTTRPYVFDATVIVLIFMV